MTESSTLKEFQELANDEVKCHILLEDETCLQGLVLLLSNKDNATVSMVLKIFSTLYRQCKTESILQSLRGLKEQLKSVLQTHGSSEEDEGKAIYYHAKLLLHALTHSNKAIHQDHTCPSAFRPKNIILRLYGISSEEVIETIRLQLLKISGVISVTFQMAKHRVIVCGLPDLDPLLLVDAIHSIGQFSSERNESSQHSQHPVQVRVVRKRSHLIRNGSIRRSKNRLYVRNAEHVITEMPPYLEETADLFEVDEGRAAPKLKTDARWNDECILQGPIDWLSNLLQKSFFW